MAAILEIRDGTPNWWLSTDIWVVPGNDPNGSPGTPIVGQTAFVWAHVANNGNSPAMGARVDFWWADPSGQILRSTANLIGSAFVDLAPGASEDVLCLVPWNVMLVNGGHECVIAAASLAGAPPPPDAFDPPNHLDVAQRNISVALASMAAPIIAVTAGGRRDKTVRMIAQLGDALDRRQLALLGIEDFRPAAGKRIRLGLSAEPIPCREAKPDMKTEPEIDLYVSRGTRAAVYLDLRGIHLERGEYALVNVIETEGECILGGCSFAVISDNEEAAR